MEQSKSKKPIEELSDTIKELSSDIKQIRNDLSYIKSKIREQVIEEKVEKSLAGEEPVEVEKRWWW